MSSFRVGVSKTRCLVCTFMMSMFCTDVGTLIYSQSRGKKEELTVTGVLGLCFIRRMLSGSQEFSVPGGRISLSRVLSDAS